MKTATALIIILLAGCHQTIYERVTIDPNGFAEMVHIGHSSLASSKTLDGVGIETGKVKVGLDKATVDDDSIKATTLYGIIETE